MEEHADFVAYTNAFEFIYNYSQFPSQPKQCMYNPLTWDNDYLSEM